MGQIIGSAAKPKRCNLNKLSQLGTPAAGEHILVSSDNSMNAAGQGNFDCYIEGDGTKAATALELKPLADVTPTSGSKNSVTSGGVWSSLFTENITTEEIIDSYTDTRVINGAYINGSGQIANYSTYFYTKPFFVKSGSVVTLKIRANSVSYLNKATGADDAGPYTSLRSGTITPSTEVTYTATEDCWLVVSGENFTAENKYVRWQVLGEPTEKYLRRDEVSDEIQEGSASAVTSGAVYEAVNDLETIDNNLTGLVEKFDSERENYKLAGAGSTYISTLIKLIKGRKYQIVFDNPSWERNDTGTDSTQYIFVIGSIAGGVSTTIFGVKRSEDTGTLEKSYEFDVPADSETIVIGGRANVGTDIVFSLEDITDITNVRTELGVLKNDLTLEITRPNGYVAYSQEAGTHYIDDENWYVGGLIPIAVGDQILINVASDINSSSSQILGVYDSNGNLFAYYSLVDNRRITISNDSLAYIALSTRIADAPLFKLTVNGVLRYQGSSTTNLSVPVLYKQVEQIEEKIETDDIYNRNADKLPLLFASSNKNLRLQFLIATDSHEGWGALQNAVDFANKCEYIQALFVLGDCTGQAAPSLSTFERYNQIINTCTKPVFCIAGNHDCGYDKRLRYTALEDKICEYIIEPTYQHLAVGEYTQGMAYYYHDFTDKKVRAIFLYEFDEPISIVENAYWEAVAFDSTKPQYAIGVQYAINDIVNFGLYTANSFRCIQEHTSSADNEIKLNEYRGYRFIGQTQMAWLVSTMLSTPSDYNIIICTHIPASSDYSNTLYRTSKFCTKFINEGNGFNGMADDYLGILAEAYNNGASGTIKVSGKGTFAYLNVLEDAGAHYAYEISYDFSGKNSSAKFACFFSGHTHVDCVFKNARNQFCITPTFTTATTRQFNMNDVPRNSDPKELAYDALTAVALDTINNCVVLTRVGTTGTTDGYLRDVDRIDII